jgi:hypothetical protein
MEYAWKAPIVPLPGEIVLENDNTCGINISLCIDEGLAFFDRSYSAAVNHTNQIISTNCKSPIMSSLRNSFHC